MNEDKLIHDFQSCTGIEDVDRAKEYLEQGEWNLLRAIELATPEHTQKLPSEDPAKESSRMEDDTETQIMTTTAGVTVADDYFDEPSTSTRRIVFNVYHRETDTTRSLILSENDTIGHLKTMIMLRFGLPTCHQVINGFGIDVRDEDVVLAHLNLSSTMQLSVHADDSASAVTSAPFVNGLRENGGPSSSSEEGMYMLEIYDEINDKTYRVPMVGTCTVLHVKLGIEARCKVPVAQQIWSGWPPGCTSDNLYLGQLGLATPEHHLSFRSAPVLVNGDRRPANRLSFSDPESDSSLSSNDDDDLNSILSERMFDSNISWRRGNANSLIPADTENETTGSIQFAISFEERYGAAHPDFFPGQLEQAFKEACDKPAKERKLLAIYLHHSGSVLTNVFCSQMLCFESVMQFLSAHFVVWGWDVSLEAHKISLLKSVHDTLGSVISQNIRSTKVERFPLLLIISRFRRNTEIIAVIHGNVDLNELLSSLIQAVDIFTEQMALEGKEDDARNARELIKVEQDKAYEQSLEIDRAKLEAKRKQEQIEMEETAKVEMIKQKEAEKKEAHRRMLESKLPPEPDEDAEGVSNIRIRIRQSHFLSRRFRISDKLQTLMDFLIVQGYDSTEYKLLTSFPRKDLMNEDKNLTLEELKLYPQETLILEEM